MTEGKVERPEATDAEARPRLVVLSSFFPHAGRPYAGVFIQNRMFRVGRRLPTTFVVPVPWFPLQSLVRRFRPNFRPAAPRGVELRDGFEIHYPRFLSFPGVLKRWDGLFMALSVLPRFRRLRREGRLDVIDAHFAFPDGDAARRLGRWLRRPFAVTLRGNELVYSQLNWGRRAISRTVRTAERVFTVSADLARLARELGVGEDRLEVVPNGVDLDVFRPQRQKEARLSLGLPENARILITVGWLTEGKGQHDVIACLPELLRQWPDLYYLIVGGEDSRGGRLEYLRQQAEAAGVADRVRFLGVMAPDSLPGPLSAADVFVLATRREGWANVLLEAMACGLPVITTDVGGNPEIVCDRSLGEIVPLHDLDALKDALSRALGQRWDREAILRYARENHWERRVEQLIVQFRDVYMSCSRAATGGDGAVQASAEGGQRLSAGDGGASGRT